MKDYVTMVFMGMVLISILASVWLLPGDEPELRSRGEICIPSPCREVWSQQWRK